MAGMKNGKSRQNELLTAQRILDGLNHNAERIRACGVREIGLFGSFLHQNASRRSDIDLLVTFNQVSFDGYMDLKFFVEDLFGRKVDLVIKDDLKPALRYILEEAVYAQAV
jgi:predicted nucleotidyltransferase